MPRILLVTNDFPPAIGGIQSYLRDFVATLPADEVIVFAATPDAEDCRRFDASVPYKVVRWPQKLLLPTRGTIRMMQDLIRTNGIDTVWFGAAAPMGFMARAARAAGARRIIASTHGHEVGWSMVPGARRSLRGIGKQADVITYIAEYTLARLKPAFGPGPEWVHLPSGVDIDLFHPTADKAADKAYFGLDPERPAVVCVSRYVPRKGQDQLLRVMPKLAKKHPGVQLLLVGRGMYEKTLREMAAIYFPEAVFYEAAGADELNRALGAADVFAMPARTRGRGLDLEGLGIVYLEAQSAGVPVIAGDSGGAPEAVTPESAIVVNGGSQEQLLDALDTVLSDAALRERMGAAGRANVEQNWTWATMGARLRNVTRRA